MSKKETKMTISANGGDAVEFDMAILQQTMDDLSLKSIDGRSVEIKKAMIKEDLFLKSVYTETRGDQVKDRDETSNMPIHDDLRNAFKNVDLHMELICEQGEHSGVKCTGISINKDRTGVCLIGHRPLSEGGVLNLVSPFISYDGEYCSTNEGRKFKELIRIIQFEAEEYLFREKWAPKAQLEMFATESTDDIFDNQNVE